MRKARYVSTILAFFAVHAATNTASATFHLMQIDQIMGGVQGDATAQAIELRTRAPGQNLVMNARLVAYDAVGENPVVIVVFDADVSNSASGIRILVASDEFLAATTPPGQADIAMTNLIPESYLAAGSLTYEDQFGTILWRVTWGGDSYTGPTSCSVTNDVDGDVAPPFSGSIPTNSLQSLDFPGVSSAKSTNSAADYVVTTGAATFSNSTGATFTVTGLPPVVGDFDGDRDVDLADYLIFSMCMPGPNDPIAPVDCDITDFLAADLEQDFDVDLSDFADFQNAFTGSH